MIEREKSKSEVKRRGWWNEKYEKKKKKIEKEMRKWRKELEKGKKNRKKRKKYEMIGNCMKKRRKKMEEEGCGGKKGNC